MLPKVKLLFFLGLLVLYTGCGSGRSGDATDTEWKRVTTHNLRTARAESESDLDFFLRSTRASNQYLRQAGSEFWQKHPNDPRRFEWLILTVHMSPELNLGPKNMDRVGTKRQDLDNYKRSKEGWEEQYSSFRAEFWASPEVSKRERRLLWFGELIEYIRRLRVTSASDTAGAKDTLVNEFIAFVDEHPEPLDKDDKVNGKMLLYLWSEILESNRSAMRWTPTEFLSLLDRLENTGATAYARRPFADHPDLATTNPRLFDTPSKIESARRSVTETRQLPPVVLAGQNVSSLDVAQRSWLMLTNGSRSLFSILFDSPIEEAQTVAAYHRLVEERVRREVGQLLWASFPDRGLQLRWMQSTFADEVGNEIYANASIENILLMLEGRRTEIARDETAIIAWDTKYGEYRNEFWQDPLVTDQQRNDWLNMELRQFSRSLAMEKSSHNKIDPVEVARFFENVHSLFESFDDPEGAAFLAKDVVQYPRRYDHTLDSLDEFVEPFRGAGNGSLQSIVDLYDRSISTRTEPLELRANTLSGQLFDVAELRGKIVYVDIWTTTCTACIEAMPALHDLYLEYQDEGFEFVSVLYDGLSYPKRAKRVVKELELTWPVLVADDLPGPWFTYMVLNRDGTVYEFHDRRERSAREIVEELLQNET